MNFEQFFVEAERLNLKIESRPEAGQQSLLSNEALFQLPLLAMVVLSLAKGRRKPKYDELGQLVGDCIEKALAGFKGSSQYIGWSANLRIRTIRALTFLELAKLVDVDLRTRAISATELGRKVLAQVDRADTNLSTTMHFVERAYRDATAEQHIRLELP
jgi:hypothetical protein